MEEPKLDILAPREDQLKLLVAYLEKVARTPEEEVKALPLTTRTRTLIGRYLWYWQDLYTKEGLTPQGALKYYLKISEG